MKIPEAYEILEERRISVTLDCPPASPPVAIDRAQMRQVFFNLVKNAVQAMGEGGRLAIALTADDRDLTVAFRDTGSGIAPEDFRRLFEPFHTTKAGGHGIGLSMAKAIVEDHGGRITATTVDGASFTVMASFPV